MFSHPSKFNDPFDCNIDQLTFEINECCEAVTKDILVVRSQHPGRVIPDKLLAEALKFTQEEKIKKCSITCFSLNHYNTLLWSYYADKHSGVCMEFDNSFEGKLKSVKDSDISEGIIDYDNNPINYCRDKEAGIKKLFFSKSHDWEHEREYRMSFLKKPGLYEFNKGFLKTICFGIKTPEKAKKDIIRLALKNDFKDIGFHQAIKDKLELRYQPYRKSA